MMASFAKLMTSFHEATQNSTNSTCLYTGSASSDNMAFCLAGFQNAAGLLVYLTNAHNALNSAALLVGENGVKLTVTGPSKDLKQPREELEQLPQRYAAISEVNFWDLHPGSLWFGVSQADI